MAGLTEVLRERAELHPDRVAFVAGDVQITYGDLDRRADRAAAALAASGVGHGDRVAILDKNSLEYAEQMFGAARIGAVQVPVNYRLVPDEVAYIVNDAQTKVLIAGPEFATVLDAIAGKLEHTTHLVVIGGPSGAYRDYATWLDEAEPRLPAEPAPSAQEPAPLPPEAATSDVFVQLYSSGTTGLPKGVMLTHDNFLAELPLAHDAWDLDHASIMAIPMPMYHVAGFALSLCVVFDGITGVLNRDPDPVAIARSIERHRATHVFLVPALLRFMGMIPEVAEADMSSLRILLYGASPISEDVLRDAMRMLPDAGFVQVYGLTETSGAITMLAAADHDPGGPNPRRLRSAGLPNEGCDLRIVDPTTLADLPTGQVGEVLCRTPQNMRGYWRLPEATASTLLPGGWLRTGDAGYLDEDGYLYIHDRVKDMIITGGENVYPAEVENALMSHPAVGDCAVIGVPDERWGETPKAIVVAAADVTDEDLIEHCRARLAGFKCPTSVERRDAIPRNPTGKILKRELRAPYWQDEERRVR